MDKLKIKEEIKALYDDIEKCISNLVVSRGKRDEQGIADAHWHMESLMVKAQQMCSVILDSLQEEPESEDLEKASRNYADNEEYGDDVYFAIKAAFEAGANWQKKQMMKESVDGLVVCDELTHGYKDIAMHIPDNLVVGDKVKVIVIKEE